MSVRLRHLLLFAATAGFCALAAANPPLPGLGADLKTLTVSGISSGGHMAVQFQVAHSSLVRGVGILAAGPYDCAAGSVSRALRNCMAPTPADPPPTLQETRDSIRRLAEARRIDAPEGLIDDRVWLFSGGKDTVVAPAVMDALDTFYRSVLPAGAIRYVKDPQAGHAMISVADPAALACPATESPFINRCGNLDAAGELLQHLLGPLHPRSAPPAGRLQPFDQRPYVNGRAIDASLADRGFVFIPENCAAGGCGVHVAFHGCLQNAGEIGPRFVQGAGYNEWAASNRLIVLYPQTARRYGLALGSWRWVLNPKGCWDWWGYTGAEYPTRDGAQIRAIRAMVDALARPVAAAK